VTVHSPEPGALERPAVTFECNECNEALDALRVAVRNARRLAFVAANALANGDVTRGQAALSALNETLAGRTGSPLSSSSAITQRE
jgi:hypothetical protein